MKLRSLLLLTLVTASCAGRTPSASIVAPTPSASDPAPAPVARALVVAIKEGRTVTVTAVDLGTDARNVLFTYRERAEAAHSWNRWEEMHPSLALSPDGDRIAFAAADGLKVYEVATARTRTLIERVSDGVGEDHGAVWSPPLADTFGLQAPRWSGDGRYISFERSHYEGSSYGFYDAVRDVVFAQESLPGSYAPALGDIAWSPGGATSAAPSYSDVEGVGVFLSPQGDPTRTSLIPTDLIVPDVAVHPDGEVVAALHGSASDRTTGLVLLGRDGSIRPVDDEGSKTDVAFDPAGDLWWAERRSLMRWDGDTVEVATLPGSMTWTFVKVGGERVVLAGHDRAAGAALCVSVERASGDVRVLHRSETDFTTYLGPIKMP